MYQRYFFVLLVFVNISNCSSKTPLPSEPAAKEDEKEISVDLPGGIEMVFVHIEPGTFLMGSERSEDSEARPQHQVSLTNGFSFCKYEVTQAQWKSIMNTEPWDMPFSGINSHAIGDKFPAVKINWGGVKSFLDKLNEIDPTAIYRLPTEAEWEYVCRAGTTTPFSFDEKERHQEFMWFGENSVRYYGTERLNLPQEVGLLKPNPWGLHDMHGNVAELVDYWDSQYTDVAQIDPLPTIPPEPVYRGSGQYTGYATLIVRGGSHNSTRTQCRSSSRVFRNGGYLWDRGLKDVGFRVVRIEK